ncbi:MAG: recombination mediator RecR [Rhodospirillales bacterium]
MAEHDIERLVQLLAKLPGLGPRSARRAVLQLLKRRESLMQPLAQALVDAAERVRACSSCGNLDTIDPCAICNDPRRDGRLLCVVEDVADLWALERTASFKGKYHVLGGSLSALDGVGPDDLTIPSLIARAGENPDTEVILATSATVDGQTTAHYIADRLHDNGIRVSGIAHGVPVGGELDFLDDGTISAALRDRRPV